MAIPNDSTEEILSAAFFGYTEDMAARVTPDLRFAHYTSAETALRIIHGDGTDQALWLRNATEMSHYGDTLSLRITVRITVTLYLTPKFGNGILGLRKVSP